MLLKNKFLLKVFFIFSVLHFSSAAFSGGFFYFDSPSDAVAACEADGGAAGCTTRLGTPEGSFYYNSVNCPEGSTAVGGTGGCESCGEPSVEEFESKGNLLFHGSSFSASPLRGTTCTGSGNCAVKTEISTAVSISSIPVSLTTISKSYGGECIAEPETGQISVKNCHGQIVQSSTACAADPDDPKDADPIDEEAAPDADPSDPQADNDGDGVPNADDATPNGQPDRPGGSNGSDGSGGSGGSGTGEGEGGFPDRTDTDGDDIPDDIDPDQTGGEDSNGNGVDDDLESGEKDQITACTLLRPHNCSLAEFCRIVPISQAPPACDCGANCDGEDPNKFMIQQLEYINLQLKERLDNPQLSRDIRKQTGVLEKALERIREENPDFSPITDSINNLNLQGVIDAINNKPVSPGGDTTVNVEATDIAPIVSAIDSQRSELSGKLDDLIDSVGGTVSGADCGSAFVCDDSPVQCAILQQQREALCSNPILTASQVSSLLPSELSSISDVRQNIELDDVDLTGQLDFDGFIASSTCDIDIDFSLNLGFRTLNISLPLSMFCSLFVLIGNLVVVASSIGALRIIGS